MVSSRREGKGGKSTSTIFGVFGKEGRLTSFPFGLGEGKEEGGSNGFEPRVRTRSRFEDEGGEVSS